MKPAPFEYCAPETVQEALGLLVEHGWDAKLLAGGQSLIPLMNFRLAQPAVLIDLNRIEELSWLRPAADGGLSIGAMTRVARLENDPEVARRTPLLRQTVPFIAHPQIRNRSTVGGSLAHADPAAELPAVALALGARFRLQSPASERWVEARDFFVGLLTTDIGDDEMLVEIAFPPPEPRTGTAFMEIARRHGDYAQVGVAASVTLAEDGSCETARLGFLSVGDTPLPGSQAAQRLTGSRLAAADLEAAAALAAERDIQPTGDIHATAAFKQRLARVVTRRVLERAVAAARNGADPR